MPTGSTEPSENETCVSDQPCLTLALSKSELSCLTNSDCALSGPEGQVVSVFGERLNDWMTQQLVIAYQAERPEPEPDYEQFFNEWESEWIQIPNWPGYYVCFRQMPEGIEDSQLPLMYPGLLRRNVQLWFHSAQYSTEPTLVGAGGILKPCPDKSIWPYCTACGKYDVSTHRLGRKHARAMWQLKFEGRGRFLQRCCWRCPWV